MHVLLATVGLASDTMHVQYIHSYK